MVCRSVPESLLHPWRASPGTNIPFVPRRLPTRGSVSWVIVDEIGFLESPGLLPRINQQLDWLDCWRQSRDAKRKHLPL